MKKERLYMLNFLASIFCVVPCLLCQQVQISNAIHDARVKRAFVLVQNLKSLSVSLECPNRLYLMGERAGCSFALVNPTKEPVHTIHPFHSTWGILDQYRFEDGEWMAIAPNTGTAGGLSVEDPIPEIVIPAHGEKRFRAAEDPGAEAAGLDNSGNLNFGASRSGRFKIVHLMTNASFEYEVLNLEPKILGQTGIRKAFSGDQSRSYVLEYRVGDRVIIAHAWINPLALKRHGITTASGRASTLNFAGVERLMDVNGPLNGVEFLQVSRDEISVRAIGARAHSVRARIDLGSKDEEQ